MDAPARLVALVALALAAAACSDARPVVDAGVDAGADAGPDAGLTCTELAAAHADRLAATSRSCTTRDDCRVIGHAVDTSGGPSCNCGVYYAPSCGGTAVNGAAWAGDATAAALLVDWRARCVPLGCSGGAPAAFDCGLNPYDCVDGACTTGRFDCFARPDATPP